MHSPWENRTPPKECVLKFTLLKILGYMLVKTFINTFFWWNTHYR